MKFTIPGTAWWLAQATLVIVIAILPIMFAKFVAPMMGVTANKSGEMLSNSYYQAFALGVLQIAKLILDKLKKHSTINRDRQRSLLELSVALAGTIGIVEKQITSFAKSRHAAAQLNGFLNHALKCIEATVQLCTDNLEHDYCGVTLLTFEQNGMVEIKARSKVSRPIGTQIPQAETLAWPVARYSQQVFVISHFRKEAKISKETQLKYRGLSLSE